MHRVLRSDGSLYLHCDPTASHYLRALCDGIFGRRNFRNEIVWHYGQRIAFLKKNFSGKHDTILFYAKGSSAGLNRVSMEWKKEDFLAHRHDVKVDEDGNEYIWTDGGPSGQRYVRMVDDVLKAGKPVDDVWDIPILNSSAKERTGFPTQKPLALYERIIRASSNPGDIVLDPFCGCATTPVAAERLGRQWAGMDIWDGALAVVRQRMEDNRQLLADPDPQIHYETDPPSRTDAGDEAVLSLRTPTGRARRRHPPPRQQHERLLLDIGAFCQGCGRDYNFDPRVLEVDHMSPRSDGGTDAYDNLTLLCPPCNRAKLDRLTLTGLQQQNRREGYLLEENERNLRIGRARGGRRRRR